MFSRRRGWNAIWKSQRREDKRIEESCHRDMKLKRISESGILCTTFFYVLNRNIDTSLRSCTLMYRSHLAFSIWILQTSADRRGVASALRRVTNCFSETWFLWLIYQTSKKVRHLFPCTERSGRAFLDHSQWSGSYSYECGRFSG